MIFAKIFPVLLMICVGALCKKFRILSQESISGMKTLITELMLPVLLFHTLATISYSRNVGFIIGVIFLQLCTAFGIGFILRKKFPSLGKLLPFVISGFEGGMMGYPLYTSLCGESFLSNIATLDIGNTIFVFTIYIAALISTVSKSVKTYDVISKVLHSSVFWGVFLGIAVGVSGIAGIFLGTAVGKIYLAGKDILTSPISALILIIVGYNMSFHASVLKKCIRTIILRIGLQGLLLTISLFLLKDCLTTQEMSYALILFFFLPPSFIIPAYSATEDDSIYLSTTISIYSLISILVFIILSSF